MLPRTRRQVLPPRGVALLLAVALAVTAGGCKWIDGLQAGSAIPAPPQNFTKAQLVEHLNQNVQKLYAWRSTDVKISAREQGSLPVRLSAMIAVESPRNFRLIASALGSNETDFGSNDNRFWFWMRRSPQKYVFTARHEEVHLAQQRMHFPFDPDWLMEALGVIPFVESELTLAHTDPEGRTVDLVANRVLVDGRRVRMVTTVDARQGIVLSRTLYDGRGRTVARASFSDHQYHEEQGVVFPHEIHIDWPQSGTALAMDVGSVDINPQHIPQETWKLPEIEGSPPFDLGVQHADHHRRSAR